MSRGGGRIDPLLFLGNYRADHPEIRYAYGSDHSYGLPNGSGTKYPELTLFRKVRIFRSGTNEKSIRMVRAISIPKFRMIGRIVPEKQGGVDSTPPWTDLLLKIPGQVIALTTLITFAADVKIRSKWVKKNFISFYDEGHRELHNAFYRIKKY